MSKIDLTILKPSNDPWQLVFTLSKDFYRRYDRCTVEVRHRNTPLDILSTTEGSIRGYKIYVDNRVSTMLYCTAYDTSVTDIETILVFYYQDNIVHQEIISSKIEYVDPANISRIREIILDMHEMNISNIDELCKKEVASFQVKLQASPSIGIDTTEANDVYMVFGDTSSIINSADLIFSVESNISRISIPSEIIWMNHKNYSGNTLGCCELVKLSNLNVYYKIPASNTIRISDCVGKNETILSHFRTPIKTKFGSGWGINENSHLPCRTE